MKKKQEKESSMKKGRMSALKNLHKMASKMMGEDMEGIKKVSVIAKDKSGLKKGLNKAEDILEGE